MTESIIVALITGGLSLVGVAFANRKTTSLLEYRLEQLEDKMNKHNNLIERMYAIEKRADVFDKDIEVANHRIADLEKWEAKLP